MRAAKRSMFTLVELMIVVIIVAILAASAVPIYSSLVSRAYEGEIVSSLGAIRTAQRVYRAEYGNYAETLGDLEDTNNISSDDFVDMKYVDYDEDEFSIKDYSESDKSYKAVWVGEIDGYKGGEESYVWMDEKGETDDGDGEYSN